MTTHGSRDPRLFIGGILPALILTVALVPLLALSPRLPEPIATTWGTDGRPNANAPQAVFVAVTLLMVGIPAVLLAWLGRRPELRRQMLAPLASGLTFYGVFAAAVTASIVRANVDQPSWTAATLVGSWSPLTIMLIAGAAGAATWAMSRRLESNPAPDAADSLPSVGLLAGERAFWIGTVRCRWAVWLAVGLVIGGAVMAMAIPALSGPVLIVVGLAVLTFTSLEVRVDRRGVRIAFGALRWPTINVELGRIAQATAIDVVPTQWCGWGYRGSLRLFGRAAIILRRGEGLHLDLVDGKRLLVTVDDAEQAAGVVNDLLRRREPGRTRP